MEFMRWVDSILYEELDRRRPGGRRDGMDRPRGILHVTRPFIRLTTGPR